MNEPETRYRFAKDFVKGGITIGKGVSIKTPYTIQDGFLSLIGSDLFSNIPMEYFESYEVEIYKRTRKSAQKSDKKPKKKRI
jgi:hypothetical protein